MARARMTVAAKRGSRRRERKALRKWWWCQDEEEAEEATEFDITGFVGRAGWGVFFLIP